jgi:hypothetical protein
MNIEPTWTCSKCGNINTTTKCSDEDTKEKCDLCNTPRPKTIPVELVATIPLAAVLLFIAIALPVLSNTAYQPSHSIERFVKIDMASLITFAHTALLGAFGTVAWLSRNPLFGSSIQLCLVFATSVTVGTVISLSTSSTHCWSFNYVVPLVLIALFGLTSLSGSIITFVTFRYPTFQVYSKKDKNMEATLRRLLLVESVIIVLFSILRGILFPSECHFYKKHEILLRFIESFHMAFHESFLLGCGWAALWSKGFYYDLLILSSGIYGLFYTFHFMTMFINTDELPINFIYTLIRGVMKMIICCVGYYLKNYDKSTNQSQNIEAKETDIEKDTKISMKFIKWIRYIPPPTIFYIWWNKNTTSIRTRVGSFIISFSGMLTSLSFHYESILLILWGNSTTYSYDTIYTSLNFGIHGMMVIPYLCGLCMSSQAYTQFRHLHIILNVIAGSGSVVTAITAKNVPLKDHPIDATKIHAFNHLMISLIIRGVSSWLMGIGFLLLKPSLLAKAIGEGTIESNTKNHFVQLNILSNDIAEDASLEEDNEDNEEKKDNAEKNQSMEMIELNNIESSSSPSSSFSSNGHSVETCCTEYEMKIIRTYQHIIEKVIFTFVLLTAVFTTITIILNSIQPPTKAINQTDTVSVSYYHKQQIMSKNEQRQYIQPEPLGYGFIFHISFLLSMFTLHGLWTGMVMTLRVGICFSLSVAIIMPSIGITWGNWYDNDKAIVSNTVVSIGAWICCISASLLFISGSYYYYHLTSIVQSKSIFVANSSSSFFKVFGRVRKR